ncbi:MAG: hypothetical protein OJJ54_08715 [Pseudonocardia sp.]|nr:hypothetical protein [Pseudonocardia sp.]
MRLGTVRILAACSAVSVAGTASATGIALTDASDLATVALPTFDSPRSPGSPAGDSRRSAAPTAGIPTLDAPVSGMQIAALGVEPAARQAERVGSARLAAAQQARKQAAAPEQAAPERAAQRQDRDRAGQRRPQAASPGRGDDAAQAPSAGRERPRRPGARMLLDRLCRGDALPVTACRPD